MSSKRQEDEETKRREDENNDEETRYQHGEAIEERGAEATMEHGIKQRDSEDEGDLIKRT